MVVLRSLRSLIFGETWAIPVGVAATVLIAVALRSELTRDAWHDDGGFILAALVAVTLLLSLRSELFSRGERKDAARRKFGRWAGSYEQDRRSRFNARPQMEALAALELRSGDRFLDVGCGTGAAVRAAAAVAERAVGVDIAPEMIRRARELAAGIANSEFVVGDSEALPFGDAAFTAVLCTASFHHYPNPKAALAEMRRVLEPGGRLVIADGVRDRVAARIADAILRRVDRSHVRLYRTEELAGLLREAGFYDIDVTTLYSGGYAIVSCRAAFPGLEPAAPEQTTQ